MSELDKILSIPSVRIEHPRSHAQAQAELDALRAVIEAAQPFRSRIENYPSGARGAIIGKITVAQHEALNQALTALDALR